jgi:hypothetical protein
MPEFAEWESFYVIVGSGAAALIGLQFVVMTLVAEKPPLRVADAGAAFATPTIVHFSTVLLLSVLLRAPWEAITPVAVLWGLVGLGGIAYALVVARRMRVQTVYAPDWEDWLSHVGVPFAAYAILVVSAWTAPAHPHESVFGVGAVAVLLLFIGIHNAWDAITYHVFVTMRNPKG